MQKYWPTEFNDMVEAQSIIERYLAVREVVSLDIMEITFDKEKQELIDIKLPEWVSLLSDHFENEYGLKQGQLITEKVITRILLRGETIH